MLRIAHIVNPVLVQPPSDLVVAQPISFEAMRIAKQQAAGRVAVDLLAVGYAEDNPAMPADFQEMPLLTRSVLDVAAFQKQRKLPLLKDILDRLYGGCEAEYLAYTNVDIGLQPHFYLSVQGFIDQGFDAFVINRRTISRKHTRVEELPLMWAEAGDPHRGWDCFVFQRDLYPEFVLGNVCVGATRVGLALLANMVAYGRCFFEIKDAHLTFHIGDERHWKNPAFADYDAHNTRELMEILTVLEKETGPFGRETIPASFLWRKRKFGSLYEFWSRNVYLPLRLSRLLNRFLRR
ncbi:MAG: hypothetical protein GWP61_22130 [Chloroflexi bacterium]|jgi:hypothetical protein|nr:hypothetical protein [Chloroflexota bacterium]